MAKNKAKEDATKGDSRPAPTTWYGKAWQFLWYEDSLASWLVNIALAFVLIKFVFYPGIGLLLGTPFPVVAVVSESMEHHPYGFDGWWDINGEFYEREQWNISKAEFSDYPFRHGFNKGDIMVLAGADTRTLERGTVIVYWSAKPYPIIHRYIGRNPQRPEYLVSKGDNNIDLVVAADLNELQVAPERVLGKAILRIPYVGYIKIAAVGLLSGVRSLVGI